MDGSISVEIALVIVSLLITVFFTVTTSVFTSLGDIGLRQMTTQNKSTHVLTLWFTNAKKLTHTILTGKTLSMMAAVLLWYRLLGYYVSGIWLVGLSLLSAFAFLMFVEFVPGLLATHYAAALAVPVMWMIKPFYYILTPLTWLMGVLSAASGKEKPLNRPLTEDELAFFINVSEGQGVLEEQKQQMLSNIFDISDIYVKSVMVPRTDMVAVPCDITKDELMKIIKDTEYSRIPVYDDTLDYIKGIIYVKEILQLPVNWKIDDLLGRLKAPFFVPETKKIDDMLKEFQKQHLQMAVVVDEYGGVSGIVTMEDILEEIVGDIWDETDDITGEDDITEVSENHFMVDGRTNIEDFCEFFGIERTDDMLDYDTVAGLIYDIAGIIPSEGDKFTWGNFSIVINSMEDNKIKVVEFIRDKSMVKP